MTAEKDVQVARKKGRWGEEVIWAMPERKHSFFQEVFPKTIYHLLKYVEKFHRQKFYLEKLYLYTVSGC